MHGKMAESGLDEADGDNEVNDPSTLDADALQTKFLKNGEKQTESPVKEKLIKSIRASFRMVNPLTSKNKRPEDTNNDSSQTMDSQLRLPKSPSKCFVNLKYSNVLYCIVPWSVEEVKQKLTVLCYFW